MGQLPVQLQGELEAGGCAIGPGLRDRRFWLAVERRVDFDRVEVFGVVGELVELRFAAPLAARPFGAGGIEDAVPCAPAGRIVPARRADPQVGHHTVILTSSNWTELGRCGSATERAERQRDFLFDPGRVDLRRQAVRVRAACRLRPAMHVVRYGVCVQRRTEDVGRRCAAAGRPLRQPARRSHRRRAAAAGRCVSADGAAARQRPHGAARNRRADRRRAACLAAS